MGTDEQQLQLHTQHLSRLHRRVDIIEHAVIAVALVVAAAVAWWRPHTWLWPAATGGSPRHWIVGIGVVALCLAIAGVTVDRIRSQLPAAAEGVEVDDRAARTRRAVYLAGFTALLTWPLWADVAQVWQSNNAATLPQLASALVIRILPVIALALTGDLALSWITSSRARFILDQADEQQDTVPDTLDAAAEGTSVTAATNGAGAQLLDPPRSTT